MYELARTSPRVRTNSAHLAAYRRRVAHFDCVAIVREALRELGPALPAGAAHIVDTRVDTYSSVPHQLPGQKLTNVDIRTVRRRRRSPALLANVSAWPGAGQSLMRLANHQFFT